MCDLVCSCSSISRLQRRCEPVQFQIKTFPLFPFWRTHLSLSCRHNLILCFSIEQELATHRIEIASLKVCSSNIPLSSRVFCHFNPSFCAGRTLPQAAAAGTRPRQFSTTPLKTRVHDAIAHFYSQSLVLLTILLSPATCDVKRVASCGWVTHLLGNHDWHSVCTVIPRRTPSLHARLLFLSPSHSAFINISFQSLL